MDPFDYVKNGNMDYLKEVSLEFLLNSRDKKGFSLLTRAVMKQDLNCVKVIYGRCPSLLYCESSDGFNALHQATKGDDLKILKFIINADAENHGRGAEKRLTRMQNCLGDTALMTAVKYKKSAEAVKLLIAADPDFNHPPDHIDLTPLKLCMLDSSMQEMFKLLLEMAPNQSKTPMGPNGWTILHYVASNGDLSSVADILQFSPDCSQVVDNKGQTPLHHAALRGDAEMVDLLISAGAETNFKNKKVHKNPNRKLLVMVDVLGDTALHIAVSNHNLEVAECLIKADPTIAYNANKCGETPLLIAIREARSHKNELNTGKIRNLLLEMQPSQSKARRGENGWTSLHYAASQDDLSAVMDIINFCPDCLELVDNEGMNFFHVAAKSKSYQVVKNVLEGNMIPYSVLNERDNNGNTPLHIAALLGDERLTLCFLYDSNVNKNTVNNARQHVLEVINFNYDKRRAGVLGVIGQVDQKDLKDQSDFDLVVGALIATVSFTAGITVPGGYISDGPNKGTAVLSKKIAFEVFVIANTFALLFSLCAVFSHYCTRRLNRTKDILHQLKVATFCTLSAIYAMMAAFIAGSFTVLANSTRLAISVCAICCCFYIFSIHPMWKIVMQEWGSISESLFAQLTHLKESTRNYVDSFRSLGSTCSKGRCGI